MSDTEHSQRTDPERGAGPSGATGPVGPDLGVYRDEPRSVSLWALLKAPLALLCAGVAIIACMSICESRALSGQVWRDAVLILEGPPLWSDCIPVRMRHVPLANFPITQIVLRSLRQRPADAELIAQLNLDKQERVMMFDLPRDTWESLLAWGRMPEPGAPEVLAGDLARLDRFVMDDVQFEVVGRIQRGVPGFTFSYALPYDRHLARFFLTEAGAVEGWLAPDGMARIRGDDLGELKGADTKIRLVRHTRTPRGISLGTILGLAFVAWGGAAAQIRFLRQAGRRARGPLAFVLEELSASGSLLWASHAGCYGTLFFFTIAALAFPIANARMGEYVGSLFIEGDLSYIGAAYASGNVLLAALATFVNNYVVQTVGLCILPSFVVPFAGVVKNLLSFALVGFVMAPIWTGFVEHYVYHCITMTLELEAYVLASFIVSVLPIRAVKGLLSGRFMPEFVHGLKVMLSGTLLVGVMLLIAALYEAATVILFT
ncbi:MAG TPA: hypothetical protein HPP77_08740 [Candidatus Hydrogenedentes bacterium]|nr:hypothetical protein [Candidatus Hydrogenedentota bacterium]HIJ72632.1 hypothetical protein [Candidatus Hydrogenedentota bacterium]